MIVKQLHRLFIAITKGILKGIYVQDVQ